MNRDDLEHCLRAAAQITNTEEVLILGSQAILGGIYEGYLPKETTRSREVDLAFLDEDGTKWAAVDGAIGEESPFYQMYGYYAQGVEVSTATLPAGWRDRLVTVESANTYPARGLALDPHDCVVAKLAAGREKDYEFALALIRAGLVDPATLIERVHAMDVTTALRDRMLSWIRSV